MYWKVFAITVILLITLILMKENHADHFMFGVVASAAGSSIMYLLYHLSGVKK